MANEGGKTPELARHAALHKTIPNGTKSIATDTTGNTFDLASLALDVPAQTISCLGRGITLQAVGFDVTIIRGAIPAAGAGHILVAGAPPEFFFVDPAETSTRGWRAAGVGTLKICVDVAITGP